MESMIIEQRDTYGLTYNIIKRLENHGLLSGAFKQETQIKPTIYAITPTFARPVQKAELTRLAQTFLHVPNFHWIVVEDAEIKTRLVTRFLEDSGLIYTHLAASTPPNYKLGKNDPNWKKPRGVEQRNAALHWLRENLKPSDKGIVFFADDDNTYAVKLFHEVRALMVPVKCDGPVTERLRNSPVRYRWRRFRRSACGRSVWSAV